MKKYPERAFALSVLFAFLFSFISFAGASEGEILTHYVTSDGIAVFVANPDATAEFSVDCQIGTRPAESVDSTLISREEPSVKTVILLDNSLSVKKKYREFIFDTVNKLIDRKGPGEEITLATFSDKISYVLKDSKDAAQLKEAAGAIEYKDQETYLTDVLYELFSELEQQNDGTFVRIIVVSDGVDNKEIGFTKEELNALISRRPYPIYALGCTNGNNNENLKSMFALSRLTGGDSFLLDDMTDNEEILEKIAEAGNTIKVKIVPQKEDRDGGKKAVRLSLTTASGTYQKSFETEMPFAEIEAVTETEESRTEATEEETVPHDAELVLKSEKEEAKSFPYWIIAAAAGVAVAVVVLVVLLKRKKKKPAPVYVSEDDCKTELADDDRTERIGAEDDATSRMTVSTLILQDVERPARRYEAELYMPITVGRGSECRIRVEDGSVSRNQCEITKRGTRVYVKNLSESNVTKLDGYKLSGEEEITSGSKLTMGRVTLTVELSN